MLLRSQEPSHSASSDTPFPIGLDIRIFVESEDSIEFYLSAEYL